jgi:hypothetical protein
MQLRRRDGLRDAVNGIQAFDERVVGKRPDRCVSTFTGEPFELD